MPVWKLRMLLLKFFKVLLGVALNAHKIDSVFYLL